MRDSGSGSSFLDSLVGVLRTHGLRPLLVRLDPLSFKKTKRKRKEEVEEQKREEKKCNFQSFNTHISHFRSQSASRIARQPCLSQWLLLSEVELPLSLNFNFSVTSCPLHISLLAKITPLDSLTCCRCCGTSSTEALAVEYKSVDDALSAG